MSYQVLAERILAVLRAEGGFNGMELQTLSARIGRHYRDSYARLEERDAAIKQALKQLESMGLVIRRGTLWHLRSRS